MLEGVFRFAKISCKGERPHKGRSVPPPVLTRLRPAWDEARLGAPGLGA